MCMRARVCVKTKCVEFVCMYFVDAKDPVLQTAVRVCAFDFFTLYVSTSLCKA